MPTLLEIITSTQKSAGSVKNQAQGVKAAGRGTDSEQAMPRTGDALFQIQEQLDTFRKNVGSLAQSVIDIEGITIADIVAAGFRRSFTTIETLTASTTLLTYPDPDEEGDILTYGVLQDSTGGRAITWDTNLIGFAEVVDPTADCFNSFFFTARIHPVSSDLVWIANSLPALGITL